MFVHFYVAIFPEGQRELHTRQQKEKAKGTRITLITISLQWKHPKSYRGPLAYPVLLFHIMAFPPIHEGNIERFVSATTRVLKVAARVEQQIHTSARTTIMICIEIQWQDTPWILSEQREMVNEFYWLKVWGYRSSQARNYSIRRLFRWDLRLPIARCYSSSLPPLSLSPLPRSPLFLIL